MKHRLVLGLRFAYEIALSTVLFGILLSVAFGLELFVKWLESHGMSAELAFVARLSEALILIVDILLYGRTLWALALTYWREVNE